jgi:prepilin-type N-terminal cleavage/methylation domain-containing protein
MLISSKHSRRSFSKKALHTAGFTLIELLVVASIMLLMTAYIFFQQSKFNSTTLLRSLSYSIALSVRQAQVYGISVRGTTVAETSCAAGTYTAGVCFAKGFGVYVPAAGDTADTYYIFADLDGDGAYDNGEQLPVFKLGKGFRISGLCAVGGGTTCTNLTSLTAYFRRPNPDACISNNQDGGCAIGAPPLYSRAYITVSNSGNTDTRSIKISDTGQIAVCASNVSDVTQC